MIGGEFDLSIGSMIGAAGMVIAIPVSIYNWPVWAAILLAFAFLRCSWVYLTASSSTGPGCPHLLSRWRRSSSCAGLTIGATRFITGRTQVSGLKDAAASDPLAQLFIGNVFGIPVSVYWWLVLAAVATWILTKTRPGNWIFGVGGDPEAARNSGVPVSRVRIALFMGDGSLSNDFCGAAGSRLRFRRRHPGYRQRVRGHHCRCYRWVFAHWAGTAQPSARCSGH